MNINDKIYVAGHHGMVGSAIVRWLKQHHYNNLILKNSTELNLINQQQVDSFFATEKPDYVFLAAAKVGGIAANNTYPADFLYNNLCIQNNVIYSAYKYEVKKLLFLGSTCIYPKFAQQPILEESLLSGYLESTNEAYAIAKIAGIKLCEFYSKQYACNFIALMPTNLYGPNDHYHLNNAHVLPALLRKFYEAKTQNLPSVEIWGTGTPLREFMHVNDLADACAFAMQNYNQTQFLNVGANEEISIKNLALLIKNTVQYEGNIHFNTTKPDGTPRKKTDSSKLYNLGWQPKINLEQGISLAYQSFLTELKTGTIRL